MGRSWLANLDPGASRSCPVRSAQRPVSTKVAGDERPDLPCVGAPKCADRAPRPTQKDLLAESCHDV